MVDALVPGGRILAISDMELEKENLCETPSKVPLSVSSDLLRSEL